MPCRELTGGDEEFERELVGTFVSSGDQCLAEILSALQINDFDTIGKRAHALKGASANIHASGLAAAASSLEIAARASSVREIDGLVQELSNKLHAVSAELLKSQLIARFDSIGSSYPRDRRHRQHPPRRRRPSRQSHPSRQRPPPRHPRLKRPAIPGPARPNQPSAASGRHAPSS